MKAIRRSWRLFVPLCAVVLMPLAAFAQPPGNLLPPEQQPKSETIKQAVAAMEGIDETKRAKLAIQLAVADYSTVHGAPPEKLDDLVPLYFAEVPRNPKTGKPFKYVREGKRYRLLDE